jgi:hypothetical protein
MLYNTYMKILLLVLLLSGCSAYSHKPAPDSVAIMPNDCANERALTNYLEQQIERTDDQATKRRYKHRLWDFRYNCNLVASK